ncbi:hypothetical protein ERO13_1Z049495v2 [Gossypium hirsutum]|nr:hypothetical protein ERO13_1Z049495v2 [Gossypium hirsutum]
MLYQFLKRNVWVKNRAPSKLLKKNSEDLLVK